MSPSRLRAASTGCGWITIASRRPRTRQEAVFHRHAAAERHRPAAHGPRAGCDAAGHPDPLSSGCRAIDALWLPGTDHAGIATQIKVEEELRDQGGPDPLRPRPREVPRARLGMEGKVRQPHRRAAEEAGRVAATGPATASRWTRAAPRPCARPSASCMKRA